MSLRLVAPYRPFPTAGLPHAAALEGFDWIDALRMVSASGLRACPDASFAVLTDVDTALPLPSLQYVTQSRELMLWWLEIAACYLESEAFDRDTIALDADQLIYGDLTPWLASEMDLGLLVRRPKQPWSLPILNGVQWWPVKSQALLGPFYRQALALAKTLSAVDRAWGADTIALARVLDPLVFVDAIPVRAGLRVRMIPAEKVLTPFSRRGKVLLSERSLKAPHVPVLDFRVARKIHMRDVYNATLRDRIEGVPA